MTIPTALIALLAGPAHAAEFDLEGYYRLRVRGYDSLSVDRALTESEGASLAASHRLWVRPKILVNEKVTVQFDVRGLDGAAFGDDPVSYADVGSEGDVALALTDSVVPPIIGGGTAPYDLSLWRAWAKVETDAGTFSFGRMPLRWGLGMWLNDGLSWNGDHGDSQDRIQWEQKFDEVFVMAAVGTSVEGLVNEADDTTSFDAAAGYKSETITAGLYAQYKRAPAQNLNLFTASLAAQADIGALSVGFEGVGRVGGGDIGDQEDATVLTGAAGLDARIDADPWKISLLAGFASGDAIEGDGEIHGFAVDRDFNTGFLLFEQPMPTLTSAASDDNRGYVGGLTTRPWVENALFARPGFGRKLPADLEVDLSVLIARVGVLPADSAPSRTGLGQEVDLSLRYTGVEQFDVVGTFGVFLPGGYFRNFRSDDFIDGFSGTVLGGQLVAQARF